MSDIPRDAAIEMAKTAELQFSKDIALVQSIRNLDAADSACEIIVEQIKEFEKRLDNNHETAIKLASFGQAITISVTDISYSSPSILVFTGYVGDQPATLIQHISQLNFLLFAAKKEDPGKPPRRIGFHFPSED